MFPLPIYPSSQVTLSQIDCERMSSSKPSVPKFNSLQSRCVPCTVYINVHANEDLLQTNEKLTRKLMDVKDANWYCKIAAELLG